MFFTSSFIAALAGERYCLGSKWFGFSAKYFLRDPVIASLKSESIFILQTDIAAAFLSISSGTPCEDDFNKWTSLNYDEVRNWYSGIDLLLITSIPEAKHETGPLPAFEAIVSGIPVIGTAVGNFANIPGPKFTTIEEGIEIVNTLKSDPEKMKALAKEQYEYVITNLTYNSFANKWREALLYVSDLKRKNAN